MPINREDNEPAAQALRDWQARTHNVGKWLRLAGIGRSTFQDWVNERITVPAWAVCRLYAATRDVSLFCDLTGAIDLGLTVSVDPPGKTAHDLRDAALQATGAQGELARITSDAARDGRIDDVEAKAIAHAAEDVQRASESVRITAEEMSKRLRVAR